MSTTADNRGVDLSGAPEKVQATLNRIMWLEDELAATRRGLVNEKTVCAVLMEALWQCYSLSGADTDGDSEWHCEPEQAAKSAVVAVEQLRDEYDEALEEGEET